MNEADLNLLPFATAADFLNDPRRFDARASWLRAVRELGGAQADALRAFAETSYSTHLDYGTEAPTFVAANGRLLADYARRRALARGARGPRMQHMQLNEYTRRTSCPSSIPMESRRVCSTLPILSADFHILTL